MLYLAVLTCSVESYFLFAGHGSFLLCLSILNHELLGDGRALAIFIS